MAQRPIDPNKQDLAENDQLSMMQENPESLTPSSPDDQNAQNLQDPTLSPAAPTDPTAAPEAPPAAGDQVDENPTDELSQEEQDALMDLIEQYDRQEESWRAVMLPEWKLLEKFWDGQQNNIWSEIAKDYVSVDYYQGRAGFGLGEDDLDLENFNPRNVNIYRAHGESIIAALSAGVPGTKFFPDDADSMDDVSTAKVYTRASELIQRRNKAPLLLVKALWILWNHGVVAAYNYTREDPKLGTVLQPIHGQVPIRSVTGICPQCGYEVPAAPTIDCPACGYSGPPEIEDNINSVPGIVGQEEVPRITEDVKLYTPLYFRVPHWVTDQGASPYIGLDEEYSLGYVLTVFKDVPEIRDKVKGTKDAVRADRWARRNFEDEAKLVTVKQRWLRTWALEEIEDEVVRESLKTKFPDGAYVVIADDNYITSRSENLDEHWTISISPISSHIYAKALGLSVKDIQEMTNELVTMVLDNIEHGTPMTFVDNEMLGLKQFKQSMTVPGALYPVKVPPGQQIGNYVFETKPSTLSDETKEFGTSLKEYGQFASGAYPSIYGGSPEGGSNTAREYVESRQQALQRLQITWKIVNEFWSEMITKATTDYLQNLRYDEKMVKPQGKNSFINVWIRKSDITGHIGEVQAESSEKFPTTWVQKQDMMMSLLKLQDPNIMAAMFHPENTAVVAETLGFPEFFIPGDDSRSKQLNEIVDLLLGAPMMALGPMGPQLNSSVQVDPDIDNHALEAETLKDFLTSEVGQQIKRENPMGYQNCVAHYKEHMMFVQMAMAQQAAQMAAQQGGQDNQGSDQGGPNVEAPPSEAMSA